MFSISTTRQELSVSATEDEDRLGFSLRLLRLKIGDSVWVRHLNYKLP